MKKYTTLLFALFFFGSIGLLNARERRSWLPATTDATIVISPEINDLLRPLNTNFRILGCQYDKSLLTNVNNISKTGLKTSTGKWKYTLTTDEVQGSADALDLLLTFKHADGDITSAGVAIAFDFFDWNYANYVLIPASVYNGNRNRIVNRGYNEGIDRAELYWKDLPQTTTPLPQLSPYPGEVSRIEVHTSNTTTPAICVFDRSKKQGFIVLTEQGIDVDGQMIDNGFIVEENQDRTIASIVISAPGVREKKPEFIGFGKSPDRGIVWKNGEERTIRLRIYQFPAQDIPEFLDKFMTVRKSVTGENKPRNLIPFSEVSRLMCNNIDKRYHENEKYQFYCPENANWISFGWIGGLINTFPMLALGDKVHRDWVKSTFDFALTLGQGESGYFYGALNHDGKAFGREAYDEFPEIVLTRKNADVLFWMVKQFMLMKAQGYAGEIKPDWEKRVKHLSEAFVDTWQKEGQWGNDLNNKTGKIAVYNTSSGVMAIGGLALSSVYYNEPRFMEIAIQAANYYCSEFVKWGMTTGACADILQNSDSETAVALMTSLMTLYELTNQNEWLEKSRDLANLCATWTTSFDYQLPSNTPLAKLGAKLTGAVWASTQNKHGAPGFCTSSGDPLFKIYRATGDERYARLIHDIVHAHAEGIQPNGQITERLTYCDADSRGSRGDGGKTGWNETNGALMAIEIPGIYVRTDINRMFVFDHLEVKVLKHDKTGVTLQIENPTNFDATVSILAENEEQVAKPLGNTSFLNWKKIQVKAGKTIISKIIS